MRKMLLRVVALLLMGLVARGVGAQAVVNPAVVPTDRMSEAWWAAKHRAIVAAAKLHPETPLLMIGDSITNNYEKNNPPDELFLPTWQRFYEPRGALNLGFSGDTTANVLWRLQNGEVAGLHPKVAVLLIGVNNTGYKGMSAEQTEVGIDAVVAELEQRLPETKILLLGILPSALAAGVVAANRAVNAYLAQSYGENPRVTYLDIGSVYERAGVLDTELFYDQRLPQHGKPLHPGSVGQREMAEAVEPTLAKLMGDRPKMALDAMTEVNSALIAVDRLELDNYDWFARHHAELAQQAMQPRVVLIGDSITHRWGGVPEAPMVRGPVSYGHVFGEMPTLNMGFGYDRVQNVLWRLRQGEFVGMKPEWVLINIGTNNLAATANARANTPAEVAAGVEEIVRVVRSRSPESKIVLMGIFPRGPKAGRFRAPIRGTNALLAARFGHEAGVTYLDIGAKFLAADGSLPEAMMPDGVHPSEAGYGVWADALIAAGIRP